MGRDADAPRRALSPAVATVLVLSVVATAWGVLTSLGVIGQPAPVHLRIATGPRGGVYHPLGQAFAQALRQAFPAAVVEVRATAGSRANMQLLERGEVDLAFAQDDTPLSRHARSIAVLHEELLHVLVRRAVAEDVTTIEGLAGRTLALGEIGSGAELAARNVLEHFGLAATDYDAVHMPPEEIPAALRDGRVDAAFVLSAMPADSAHEACRDGSARLLSIGDGADGTTAADGLSAVDPRFTKGVIPAQAYWPEPTRAAHTVGVHAVLLCTPELDEDLVAAVTRILFENRARLAESHPVGYQLHDRFEPERLRYPPHPGAIAYYRRNEPAFVVQYAEAIGLCFTIAVGLASSAAAFRQWMRRRRKERIDRYYQRIIETTRDLATASEQKLLDILDALENLRREAFADLVREKLRTDEAFTIFQDFVQAEVEVITARLDRMRTAS